MMSTRLLLTTIVACCALGCACAAPARAARSVQLGDALNRTVCPLRVELDEDADRVPRRIKLLRCAAEPAHWCRQHLPPHECCQRRHGAHALECVELRDTVLVYYKSSRTTAPYAVSVGCGCMVVRSASAPPVPQGPT